MRRFGSALKRHRYVVGAVLGVLLTALAVAVVASQAKEAPSIQRIWPLGLAVGASLVTWWIQGVISALVARPRLGRLRVLYMTRVYLAGAFVGGISPIRGAEIPYEVYMIRRLGLSAGEGSTVVITRGLLNVTVLTLGALVGLLFADNLPKVGSWKLVAAALGLGGVWALGSFLVRRRRARNEGEGEGRGQRSGRREKLREKVSHFLKEMWQGFALLWTRDHRELLLYSAVLMAVYWAFRLSFGPLALMAAGWSGDWAPVVLAQLFISSFVLPLAPTPGGSGATELAFAGFLSAYAPQSQLISAVIIYAGLTHYLPTVVGAFFTGRQLWRAVDPDEPGVRLPPGVRPPEEG